MSAWLRTSFPHLLAFLVAATAAGIALGDASHHVAIGPGSQGATLLAIGRGNDRGVEEAQWEVGFLPASLWAWRAYDDSGKRGPLPGVSRVENALLNMYVGRHFAGGWEASVLATLQHLRAGVGAGSQTTFGVGDTVLSLQRSQRVGWGILSFRGAARIPGTYATDALATSKQLDLEAGALAWTHEILPRVGASLGLGYRLRTGHVQDEVAITAIVPVRITDSLGAQAALNVGVPVGSGSTARNATVATAGLRWQSTPGVELLGSYSRTVYGRNVVAADVVSVGVATAF